MQEVVIKCPAKINLNLKIINKRTDGFHNIESVMQTINLFDYLTIKVCESSGNQIILSGNSSEIPYDESNLVYKATKLFLEEFGIKNRKISIYIDKNIPVAAGLAGGSTDAAGVLYGLSKIFSPDNDFNLLHDLCAKLGSDLNVCLQGGRILAKGRGEIIHKLPFEKFKVSLIKPVGLGISAKEAYKKFALKTDKTGRQDYLNDLEWAVIGDYGELKYIKQKYPYSMMTGSGSTYFVKEEEFEQEEGFWVMNDLCAIDYGVSQIKKTGEN